MPSDSEDQDFRAQGVPPAVNRCSKLRRRVGLSAWKKKRHRAHCVALLALAGPADSNRFNSAIRRGEGLASYDPVATDYSWAAFAKIPGGLLADRIGVSSIASTWRSSGCRRCGRKMAV